MNNWKKIWESRKDNLANVDKENYREVFAELARIDGYDIKIPSADSFHKQYESIKDGLELINGGTAFEVGCGAGAYLYLLARDGFKVGGLDYSPNMLSTLKKVLPADKLLECICAEADELPTDKKFDAVFS